MDPRDFFDESVKAAKILNRRAVLVYGPFNEPPRGLNDDIIGVPYAPYSRLFPRAACVVHQGGVGTTGQVLRAGVPHLIMKRAVALTDARQYASALGDYRRAVKNDPENEEAKNWIDQIITIYGSLGRTPPPEGEEPPPLPFNGK